MTVQSLYEKLGGTDTIAKVVDRFYELILADPTVSHFFEGTDMEKQKRHQTAFISFALGSGRNYSGKSMAKAHEGMNLQPEHFQAIVNHLTQTLREFQVSDADLKTIIATVGSLRDDILYK